MSGPNSDERKSEGLGETEGEREGESRERLSFSVGTEPFKDSDWYQLQLPSFMTDLRQESKKGRESPAGGAVR